MDQDPDRPLFATLTQDSTREEVLAALAEQDQRDKEHRAYMATVEFPDVPEGFVGCVWSKCGNVRAHYGRRSENSARAAQDRAGEEDQTPEVWEGA